MGLLALQVAAPWTVAPGEGRQYREMGLEPLGAWGQAVLRAWARHCPWRSYSRHSLKVVVARRQGLGHAAPLALPSCLPVFRPSAVIVQPRLCRQPVRE